MPDKTAIDFSDLDYLPGDDVSRAPLHGTTVLEISAEIAERTLKATNKARVKVNCGKCGGSGCYLHYGTCFQCQGRGYFLRAANYEANRAARERRRQKQAEEARAAADADAQRRIDNFKAKQPELAAWLAANRESNDFARSLCDTVAKYGNLSVGQEAAVRRNLTPVAEPAGEGLDVSSLRGYYAVPDGETRLKLCVRHPGKQSKYHGWVFVDDGAVYGSRQTYGKQRPGGKYQGRVQQQLAAILADPLAAQVAYGKLTGTCGHCGRLLEDAESIAAGIGPICAGKVAAGLA